MSDDLKIQLKKVMLNSDAFSEKEDQIYEIQERSSSDLESNSSGCCGETGPRLYQLKSV